MINRLVSAFTSLATSLDIPTADIDLVIAQVDPQSGNVIRLAAWSGQMESTLEMAEFRAEASGTYQAFISARSCRRAPWYLGYAWNAIPLRPALLSLLLLGCPAVDAPDAAVDAGGKRACSSAVNPWASTVLEIGVAHPVPTFAIDPDSGTCLESGQLSLARVDAPGSGRVFWSADGGLFVEASSGGVYVLRVDEYSVFSNELYFAKRAVLSAHWAEPCAEVRRLENDVWSCGGKLYSDGGVISDGATRWLAVPDSGIASQWEDGIHVAPLAGC